MIKFFCTNINTHIPTLHTRLSYAHRNRLSPPPTHTHTPWRETGPFGWLPDTWSPWTPSHWRRGCFQSSFVVLFSLYPTSVSPLAPACLLTVTNRCPCQAPLRDQTGTAVHYPSLPVLKFIYFFPFYLFSFIFLFPWKNPTQELPPLSSQAPNCNLCELN